MDRRGVSKQGVNPWRARVLPTDRRRELARAVAMALQDGRPRFWSRRFWFSLAIAVPMAVHAQTFTQTIAPGTYATTIVVGAGQVAQIQGGVNVSTGSSLGVAVSLGGWAVLDTTAGPQPGAINVTTTTGTALQNLWGQLDVPNAGLTITTGGGIGVLANATGTPATVNIAHGATVNVTGVGVGLGAYGAAAQVSASDVAINLGGSGRGVVAQSGGDITLSGTSSIIGSGTGTNQLALGAAGASSKVTVTAPMTITMTSPNAMGVYMYGGGVVALPANQVFTFNAGAANGAVGMIVDNTSVPTDAIGDGLTFHFNTTPASTRTASSGVVVINGGSVSLGGLVIDGANAATGVWVRNGSSATLSQGQISVSASGNAAYSYLTNAKLLDPAGGNLGPTFGGTAALPNAGLKTEGGTISATGTDVSVNSTAYTAGAYAWSSTLNSSSVYPAAVLDFSGVTIANTGAQTYGVLLQDGGQLSAVDTHVNTVDGAAALAISDYGTRSTVNATLSGGAVTASGADVPAMSVQDYAPNGQNTIMLTGTSVQSSDGVALEVVGPAHIVAQQGAQLSGGAGLLYAYGRPNWATTAQPTLLQLDASNSTLTGLAQADASSIANITLSDQSSWTGEAYYVSNVNVDPTSSWFVTAGSVLSGQLLNNGLVEFTAPQNDVYKSLYVHDYAGSGTLRINTFLGDDASPTDRLYINGGVASSQGSIAVKNTGGPGALTSANGIPVVEVLNGGTTLASAFALAGPVVAGPYEYTLQRGGVSPGTENYWFLRSTVSCEGGHPGCPEPPAPPVPPDPPPPPAPPAPGPPSPAPPGPPSPPPDPPGPPPVPAPEESGEPSPADVVPNYRPEVSLYSALPALALRYGWSTLGNLHERVGDEEQLRERDDLLQHNPVNGLWVRVIGEDGDVDGSSQSIYGNGPKYDYNIAAFQAGLDIYAQEHDNQQRDHAGFYLGTGRIRSEVTNYDGTDAGRDEVKGQSLGLYWTHFWSEGAYLDAVWQGTWSKSSAQSLEGLGLHRSNFGWAGSLESGYPFHDETQVWEPQAQVIYQRVNRGQSSDAAATVMFDNITSLAARLGLRWANTWTQEPTSEGTQRLLTGWLRFNLWKEFQGQPTTSFSSEDGFVPFQGSIKGSWWQLNGGMTWQLDKNTSFYANLGYQKGFDNRGFHAWDGKLGFRWNW
jgi:autotransporter family porin